MSSSAGLLERGRALYRRGAFAAALRAFERFVDAHPRSAEGWLAMAYVLLRLREAEAGLAACEVALDLMPNNAAALALRERIAAERASVQVSTKEPLELPPEIFELVPALFHLIGSL